MILLRYSVMVLILSLPMSSVHAQTLGQGSEDPVSLWRVAASLLVCLVLAVIGAFVLRSRGLTRGPLVARVRRDRRLELVDSLRLPNQTDLCLVTCDGRRMLLATSAYGLQVLPLEDGLLAPPNESLVP